jgi:hypothetical protein
MADEGYTFEWPLWGMSLGDLPRGLGGGLRIHDFLLYQPTWAEWAEMELTAVVDEYCRPQVIAEAMGKDVARLPPPCLLGVSDAGTDGELDPSEAELEAVARATVAAFRLYGRGDFVDPNETGTYISQPGQRVSRRVSALRCAFYDWTPSDPYVVEPADLQDLGSLASDCYVIREEPEHANAAIVLENFLLSFGAVTSPAESGLHRFIALEALFGGLREERYGAPFAVRVANTVPEYQADVRDWIVETGTELRNDLAHRTAEVMPDREDLETLEDLVRHSLISYLNHVGNTENATLTSFNKALAQAPIPSEP